MILGATANLWLGRMIKSGIHDRKEPLGVARGIRMSYWLAIALIALLAASSFWVMDRQIRSKFADSTLVDLAGEQKMLSQRIALLTHTAANTDSTYVHAAAVNELRNRITTFETNHAVLGGHIRDGNFLSSDVRERLSSFFSSPPYDVDFFARHLIKDARRFAELSGQSPQSGNAKPISKASASATLAGYAHMADLLAVSAEKSIAGLTTVYRLLFAAMMLVLALTVVAIFQPMFRAVTQRAQELMSARNEMAYLAAHDRLTGLRNRMFLTDHFEHMIENARRREERVAVLHLDLDHFKAINDAYGHMAGDMVLATVAKRIKNSVRAADIPARLGGDEFVVLLNAPGTADDIASVANRIVENVNEPIHHDNVVFRCGASIGIATYPEDASKPDDLLIGADLALYRAKSEGGGCVRFFSADLRKEHEIRRSLEADLRESLSRSEIKVAYQPQISLATGKVTGVEALARWHRNQNELVPPDIFIPVAEQAGLLEIIGRYIMSTAIAQAAHWNRAGLNFGRVSLNVAWTELMKEDFVEFLLGKTTEHGLPNTKLAIEIVEGTILQDERADVAGKLRQLRNAGVFVELDDFGTGYASLTRISANEIDRLKIDTRFIRNIDRDRGNRKIVRALVDLAHGLNIAVVAEGAETEAEVDTLREIGCGDVQGYAIAHPMAANLLTEWLMLNGSGSTVEHFQDRLVRA